MNEYHLLYPFKKSLSEKLTSTTRTEYWSFVILVMVLNGLLTVIYSSGLFRGLLMGGIFMLINIVLSVNLFILWVGRFVDAGYPGWVGILSAVAPIFLIITFSWLLIPFVMLFNLIVLLSPSKQKPIVVASRVQDDAEPDVTLSEIEEVKPQPMSEELGRLVDWYLQRRQDGVSPEELEQSMRKAGHSEESIEEVLRNV